MTQKSRVLGCIKEPGPLFFHQYSSSAVATTKIAPSLRFAYVANALDDILSTYSIDAMTGQLQPNGSVGSGGSVPVSITTDPSGHFAYSVLRLRKV